MDSVRSRDRKGFRKAPALPDENCIPNLPGNRIYRAEDFQRRKQQLLSYSHGIPVVNDQEVALRALTLVDTNAELVRAPHDRKSLAAHCDAKTAIQKAAAGLPPQPAMPAWLAFDKMVLRFYGYFAESASAARSSLPGAAGNPVLRRCSLLHYLEDGSTAVLEPRQENSGLPHGTLLRRHRVVKEDGTPLGVADLGVGRTVKLYGREYTLLACDAFTRKFMEREGAEMAQDEPYPPGLEASTSETRQAVHARRGTLQEALLQQATGIDQRHFLATSGKVLRFWCSWDDTASPSGDVRPFVLHYYLVDDTVEVQEVLTRNSGREFFPKLLHRMPLPKTTPPVGVRPMSAGARQQAAISSYKWADLRLGNTIKVFGRDMMLEDCDDFTRRWYRSQLGLTDDELCPVCRGASGSSRAKGSWPTEECSSHGAEAAGGEVESLVPRAAQPDFHHFIENDGKVLRFAARMVDGPGYPLTSSADTDRRFVISYHLANDTLGIFEPPNRAVGLPGGKFLERRRLIRPGEHAGACYTAQDMFMGARIVAAGRLFELLDADLFTLKHMESKPEAFPQADAGRVVAKLRAAACEAAAEDRLRAALVESDPAGRGVLAPENVSGSLKSIGVELTAHEVVTLARKLQPGALPQAGIRTMDLLQCLGM